MAVLVGYSDSVEGAAALRAGAQEARMRQLPLTVVDLSSGDDGGAAARRALEALEPVPTGAEVVPRPEHQDVAAALLDHAASTSADLVVIGSRRRSPVGKLLMGSTAQRIILGSDVPVLVVKAARDARGGSEGD